MESRKDTDRCIRAMTNDGGFRLIAVSLSETVASAAEAQKISGPVSGALAELMVSSVLLRETTSPGRRVQIALRDDQGGRLIADSLPDGLTRGLVIPSSEDPPSLTDARVEVTYTLPNGALHKGIVALTAVGNISAAMMAYLQESEQILTTISVAAISRQNGVRSDARLDAAGFAVQLLPELERAELEIMTERLSELEELGRQLERGLPTPDQLVERIFEGFEYTILAESPIRFGCNCSRERILDGLGSLPDEELQALKADGQKLDVHCDACGKNYSIGVEELDEL